MCGDQLRGLIKNESKKKKDSNISKEKVYRKRERNDIVSEENLKDHSLD